MLVSGGTSNLGWRWPRSSLSIPWAKKFPKRHPFLNQSVRLHIRCVSEMSLSEKKWRKLNFVHKFLCKKCWTHKDVHTQEGILQRNSLRGTKNAKKCSQCRPQFFDSASKAVWSEWGLAGDPTLQLLPGHLGKKGQNGPSIYETADRYNHIHHHTLDKEDRHITLICNGQPGHRSSFVILDSIRFRGSRSRYLYLFLHAGNALGGLNILYFVLSCKVTMV